MKKEFITVHRLHNKKLFINCIVFFFFFNFFFILSVSCNFFLILSDFLRLISRYSFSPQPTSQERSLISYSFLYKTFSTILYKHIQIQTNTVLVLAQPFSGCTEHRHVHVMWHLCLSAEIGRLGASAASWPPPRDHAHAWAIMIGLG